MTFIDTTPCECGVMYRSQCNCLLKEKPMENKVKNPIRPEHYKVGHPLEAINIIEHYNLDFCLGNTVKYVLRAGKKDESKEIEDYKKALWYLQRKIQKLEEKNNEVVTKMVQDIV